MDLDTLRRDLRPQAEKQVKVRLALEKIADLEALTATDEEVEEEYKRISDAYNVPMEQVKNMVAADDIKADLLVGKAMKLVKENAKTVAPAAEKKPATKKAKAEKTEKAETAKKTAKTRSTAKKDAE